MRNLKYLKDKPEYKRVSITEDYTINERNLIRQVGEEVKEKIPKKIRQLTWYGVFVDRQKTTKVPKNVFQTSQQATAMEMETQA